MRIVALLALTLAVGCSDRPSDEVRPLQLDGPARVAETEPPPPEIVQPHLNRRELSEAELRERERLLGPEEERRAGGGGGGFGDRAQDWVPRPEERASPRDVDALMRSLDRQLQEEVDGDDDPCAQLATLMQATEGQMARPGEPEAIAPEERELRSMCGALPAEMRQCFDREYFREHLDECQQQFQRLERRGQRQSDRARRQLEESGMDFGF